MQRREYRANWPSPALGAALLAVLLAAAVSVLATEASLWLRAAYVFAVAGSALQYAQSWRWRLTTNEDGIAVDSAFSRRKHVGWHEIEALRTWPPAVKPRSHRRIHVFLSPRTVRELDRLAARARDEPDGTLLQSGESRLNPADAYWAGSAARFLLVVLVGAIFGTLLSILTDGAVRMASVATGVDYEKLRWLAASASFGYLAFLLLARTRRTILVGSVLLVGGMAAVAAGLWIVGFDPSDAAVRTAAAPMYGWFHTRRQARGLAIGLSKAAGRDPQPLHRRAPTRCPGSPRRVLSLKV